jgi:hypothetical protein
MKNLLTIGGALLALAAFASTADARMGGGMGMSSSMSHGGGHGSMSSSLGSPRGTVAAGFNTNGGRVDLRTAPRGTVAPGFNTNGGRVDVGAAQPSKGSHWKHPIDWDGGGADDPPKKPSKGHVEYNSNGGGWSHDPYGFHNHHNGYYDQWGHHHGPYPSGSGKRPPALACQGRIGGC